MKTKYLLVILGILVLGGIVYSIFPEKTITIIDIPAKMIGGAN